jgi:intracellular sulfur oxidation DsrE/DsrF family protein
MLGGFMSATPRRGFIGGMAAALGLGMVNLVPERAEAAGAASRAADPQLEAWFAKLNGKHRVVFDAPAANEGMPAVWPRVYLNTMGATYPGEAATAMVILRHKGLALALQDSIWAKYHVGEMVGGSDAALTKNPFATITSLPLPGIGVVELLKAGVLIGACDVALTVYSAATAAKMKMDAATVKKEWVAGLYPGIQVVPSGVMAVARAQEFNTQYIFAG